MTINTKLLPWARGRRRVKRLAVSVCMYVCLYVCVQKTQLFTALLLEDCHGIALNRLVVDYLFFERCPRSRDSLLSVQSIAGKINIATFKVHVIKSGLLV